jgi:hypothetical protein
MRVIAHIPHPKININIFAMNDKFQIQFVAGQMEQIFKITQNEVDGIEGIKQLVDEDFITTVMQRFNEMYLSFNNAKDKY